MHQWVVLSHVTGVRGWRTNAGFVLVAHVLLSHDCSVMSGCVSEVMCRLAVDAIAGGETCSSDVNEYSDVSDVVMRQLVMNVVRDGSEVTGEMRCMFVGGEVCSVGVSSLLSPRLLSPRLLSPGS